MKVVGTVEGFSGVMDWSPASLTFEADEEISRLGMVHSERARWYAQIARMVKVRNRGEIVKAWC